MNKKGLLLFPAALLLASCADTNELFKGDASSTRYLSTTATTPIPRA